MEISFIGYFCKTFGIKGLLVLKSETAFFFNKLDALFIETSVGRAPFFIREIRENNIGLIVNLEEIDSVEKAKLLLEKKIFINSELIIKNATEINYVGYSVIDKKQGLLGTILSTSYNGSQILLYLNYRGKELILPFVNIFIEKIDKERKKIFFNSPEGLINLYLEEED